MNKKIVLALSLALIAIVMASAVSADENVTIDGIDFNIPDGYTEDVDAEIVNETETDEGMTYISNAKAYESEDNYMLLLVAAYEGENASDDAFADIEGDNLTINGVDGKLVDMYIMSIYCYVKDGKLVTLTSDISDEFEKFII
ncbi:hypothetical protein [Methanobrevibacter sp.]|uniref:hypothetical protein n=1 Tax=Methanobrevibacter sp. TaxID=66852 RepID=UPI003870005C